MIGAACFLLAIYYYWSSRRYIAVALLFFAITGGFQLLPLSLVNLPALGITKPYDWIFLFAGFVFLIQPNILLQVTVWEKSRVLAFYLFFLVLLLYYSIFVKEIEGSVAIRVFRNFMFFITLLLFTPLSRNEIKSTWRLIIYATSAGSAIYCLQPVIHMALLNSVTSDLGLYVRNSAITRYYNIPVFVCPIVFFLFYSRHIFDIRYRNILLVVNMLAIVLSQHRNLIIAVVLCYFVWLMLNNKMKPVAIIYLLLLPILFVVADNLLKNRLTKGFDDIGQLSSNNDRVRFNDIALSDLSTTEFRRLLFVERLDYIKKENTRFLLGIGLLTDDSQKAKSLRFYIGIPDDDGEISQIANIDIAWASLLLQLGLIGTSLFVLIYVFYLHRFYGQRVDPYMQTGILYILSLFVSSFYGSIISMPYTMCMLMLFAAYHFNITNAEKEI